VDPKRLVFLDETGAKTNMTRLYARARKGERAIDHTPHGHWSTTTLVAGLTCSGPVAPMALDGPMDAISFEAYVQQMLVPTLKPGAIVVMDNLGAHKPSAIARLLNEAGIGLWYLPPYSPDFNPIELMWSKVKTSLRSAKARTLDTLYPAIADALREISVEDSRGYFSHCFVGIIN
jgi:transposase